MLIHRIDFTYAPTYHGKHEYIQYDILKEILRIHLKKYNSLMIDVDLLFLGEMVHYVEHIFAPVLKEFPGKKIFFQSNDIKRPRLIRKMFKRLIIPYENIIMYRYKHIIEVKNE